MEMRHLRLDYIKNYIRIITLATKILNYNNEIYLLLINNKYSHFVQIE